MNSARALGSGREENASLLGSHEMERPHVVVNGPVFVHTRRGLSV